MNPQDLSAYITTLLRSGPEIIASFLMGAFLTGMLVLAVRRWVFPGREHQNELARKDAEIARKAEEVARRDAQIARVEAKLVVLEAKLSKKRAPMSAAPSASDLSLNLVSSPSAVPFAQLEAENRRLVQDKQSLEKIVENLQMELAQVKGELAHLRKWEKVFDEENARLTESGSLAKG